jgi:hypothetical protein
MERTIASPNTSTGNSEVGGIAWRPIFAAVMSFLAMVWQKIRAGIWGVRNNLSSDFAKPLDIDRISSHLAVVNRAEEEGRRNLPPSDEEVPGGTQREIIAYFTNLRRRARQQVAEAAEKTSRTLDQIHIADSLAKVRDLPAVCENKILRHFADFESHLNNAVEREQKQKRHYDAFRKKNGLDRLANYPGTAYLNYLIVPVLIVAIAFGLAKMVETYATGEAGVSVAWIVSVSVAAVIVPFILGDSLLRSINHIGEFRKFIGWIGAIVAIAAVSGMAFYTDFHIAAVLANPDATNRDVLDAMLAAPLDVISSVASWKVFGLVGLAGLFAMLLAYRSDDLYPGYGATQRTYDKARNAREGASARLRKRVNSLIDETDAEVASTAKTFNSKVRTYTRLAEKSKQAPSTLNDYDVELEEACNLVLDRYRAANGAARESDLPMSFAEHVCFNPDNETDSSAYLTGSSHVSELQGAIVELENEADSARKKLRTLNLRVINSIAEPQPVDTDQEE